MVKGKPALEKARHIALLRLRCACSAVMHLGLRKRSAISAHFTSAKAPLRFFPRPLVSFVEWRMRILRRDILVWNRRLQKPATRSAALLLCVAFHALLLYCLCQSHVLYFCTVSAFVGCGFAGVCFVGSIPAVGGSDNRTNIRTVCKSDFFAVYFCGHFFEMNGQKGKSGN